MLIRRPTSSTEDLTEVQECFEESSLNMRLINNRSNLGLPGSLNEILKRSRGKYFVRVDAEVAVHREQNVLRRDRILKRKGAFGIGRPDDPTALDRSARNSLAIGSWTMNG